MSDYSSDVCLLRNWWWQVKGYILELSINLSVRFTAILSLNQQFTRIRPILCHCLHLLALQKSANKSANIHTIRSHSLLKCEQFFALQFCAQMETLAWRWQGWGKPWRPWAVLHWRSWCSRTQLAKCWTHNYCCACGATVLNPWRMSLYGFCRHKEQKLVKKQETCTGTDWLFSRHLCLTCLHIFQLATNPAQFTTIC